MHLTCPSEFERKFQSKNNACKQNERSYSEEAYSDKRESSEDERRLVLHIDKKFHILKKIREVNASKHNKVKRENKYFWKHYVLPNILGCSAFFIFAYIYSILPCDNPNSFAILFKNGCEMVFSLGFYHFMAYHLLFPYIYKKIKSKKNKQILKTFLFCFFVIIPPLFQYFYIIGLLDNSLFMHLTTLVCSNLLVFIICRLDNMKFAEIKKYYFIFIVFVVSQVINFYFIKGYLILNLKASMANDLPILFKLCLFVYFNIYRRFLIFLMIKLLKLCKSERIHGSRFGLKILCRYFLSDLMSSVLIPALVQDNKNESYSKDLINIILFSYQMALIYNKQNFLLNSIKSLFYYLFKKKDVFKKDEARKDKADLKESIENQTENLMTTLLNEIMPHMYLKIIHMYLSRRFIVVNASFLKEISDSCFGFDSKIQIKWEFIVLLITINIIIYVSISFSKNTKIKLFTKNSKTSFIKLVFHSIITYYYVETHYQFDIFLST